MNTFEMETFNRAVGLAQAGQKEAAHAQLRSLEATNPNDSNLLLWLAFTSTDLTAARNYLNRAGRLDPANPSLASAQTWLAGEEAKVAYAPMPAAPPIPAYNAASYADYRPTPMVVAQQPPLLQPEPLPTYQTGLPSQPNNAMPDWYRPEREDEPSRPQRPRTVLIAIGVVGVLVLVGVIALVLSVLGVFGSGTTAPTQPADTIAAQGLPVYPSAKRLQFSEKDRAAFDQAFNDSVGKGTIGDFKLKYEIYSIKTAEKTTIQSFYDTEIKKTGWTAPANLSVTKPSISLKGYKKGQQLFFVEFISLASLTEDNAEKSRYNLTDDDSVLIVAAGEIPPP